MHISEEETPHPMDVYSLSSLDFEEEEATPIVTKELLCSTVKDPSPILILAGLLGTLEPKEDIGKRKPSNDKRDKNMYRSMISRRP